MIYTIDRAIFGAFNSLAGVSPFFDMAVRFSAVYLIFAMIVGVLALAGLWAQKNREQAFFMLVLAFVSGFVARVVIAEPVRILVARARPYEVLPAIHQLVDHALGRSFPSGHATLAFAIAGAVFFVHRKAGVVLFFVAGIVSISRVIAGVHWPSDVAAGAILGMATAWAAYRVMMRKDRALNAATSFLPRKL